jgi:hypothetical protein
MAFPRFVMETEDRDSFCYQDGYEGVTVVELKDLLRLSRETVYSLEEELAAKCCQLVIFSRLVRQS